MTLRSEQADCDATPLIVSQKDGGVKSVSGGLWEERNEEDEEDEAGEEGEEDEEMWKARMRTRWRHSGANGSRRKAAGGRTRI